MTEGPSHTIDDHRLERRQALLFDLILHQRHASGEQAVLDEAAHAIGQFIGADRTGFFELPDDETVVFANCWTAGHMPPLDGPFPAIGIGASALAQIRAGETIAFSDANTDAIVAGSVFPQIGTLAGIGAPVIRDGRWQAGLYVNSARPRSWQPDEIVLVREVVELTWDAVERLRARAAAAEHTLGRERAWANSPDLLCVIDLKTAAFERVNPAWASTLGWSAAEIEGCSYARFVHSDDLDASTRAFECVQRGEPVLRFENRYRTKDGAWRWFSWVALPEGGKLYCSTRDVTEEKLQAAALAERTTERDRAWSLSRDLLVVARPDGTLESVNPAWRIVLGWDERELIGKPFIDFTHPDDLDATVAAFESIFREPLTRPYEYRFRHQDGSYRWMSWTGVFDGGKVYAAGRNLTQEKQQAETLRQSETRAAAYFNFSDDYLFLTRVDADGIAYFDDINPACERAMGLTRADIIGRRIGAFLPSDSLRDITKYARLCIESRQPQNYTAVREYVTGRKIVINGRVAFVERFDDGGGLVLFSGNDVTEQLRTEEALRQAQKMEAVGQLTGGLAHDFNNLLAGISGALELMQTRMGQGRFSDLDRYMSVAQGAAKRAAGLTHRLLAFSRRQTLDPKPTDVNRLIAGMEELVRRTIGPLIPLEVVGAAGLWPTLIDPSQLENALLNLCINARDAMPEGGRITIETANKWFDRPASITHDIPEGQYLSVCVTDTGTGMPPDVIAKVFDPFFTTKPIGQGTGLGLSMIYGFAKQSGGQVRIYSEVGEGTTVCLYLPRHHGEAPLDEAAPDLSDVERADQGETVLIVDDEPSVRMLVTEVLEDLGYTAIEAADSVAGLKVLQSDVRIDLLVTDVGLPGGMNGRQMADAGRERRRDLKVLFITGYAENAAIGNGHLGPGMQVLTKPFAMEALAARIRELITSA